MKERMMIGCLLFSLNTAAQREAPLDSTSTQADRPKLTQRLRQAQEYLDTKARAKVDQHYMEGHTAL